MKPEERLEEPRAGATWEPRPESLHLDIVVFQAVCDLFCRSIKPSPPATDSAGSISSSKARLCPRTTWEEPCALGERSGGKGSQRSARKVLN